MYRDGQINHWDEHDVQMHDSSVSTMGWHYYLKGVWHGPFNTYEDCIRGRGDVWSEDEV